MRDAMHISNINIYPLLFLTSQVMYKKITKSIIVLRYRGVCLPLMASSLSADMGTQQFTDGSQLGWLWTQRNWSDPVHLQIYPLKGGWAVSNNTRITHRVL